MNAKGLLIRISVVLAVSFVGLVILVNDADAPVEQSDSVDQADNDANQSINKSKPSEYTELRMFTDQEFKVAYDNLSHPNITPILIPPNITDDPAVDEIIRELAQERGYQLRQVASGLLNQIDGIPVQHLLIEDWRQLKNDAINAGINIDIRSGYRSVEEQRELFRAGLIDAGVDMTLIADRSQDALIDSVLQRIAPPGYSRHHNGYTIDLFDSGYAVFGESEAYGWISADNFKFAKQYGFVPSYPDNAENQGPNPEPWEFVWVGKTVTYQ